MPVVLLLDDISTAEFSMVAISVRRRSPRPTWLAFGCVIIYLALFLFVTRGEEGKGGRQDGEGELGRGEVFSPTNTTLPPPHQLQYKDRRKQQCLKESVTTEWPMLQAERRDGTAWTLRWRESVPKTWRCARTYAVPSSVRLGGGRLRFGLRLWWWWPDWVFGPLHPQVSSLNFFFFFCMFSLQLQSIPG